MWLRSCPPVQVAVPVGGLTEGRPASDMLVGFVPDTWGACMQAVRAIHEEFHNKGWERFNSEKRCCVAYARIQTRRALISHFQNSSLMHEDKRCRPVLLNLAGPAPEIEEFPAPRRASHSSHSRRGGGRSSGRRESIDSQAASHRGSEPPTAPGTGNNTPRLSQESFTFGRTAGRATS